MFREWLRNLFLRLAGEAPPKVDADDVRWGKAVVLPTKRLWPTAEDIAGDFPLGEMHILVDPERTDDPLDDIHEALIRELAKIDQMTAPQGLARCPKEICMLEAQWGMDAKGHDRA